MRRALAAASVVVLFVASTAEAAETSTTYGLSIAVAVQNGQRVRDDAWIRSQIDGASELFSDADVSFRWTMEKELPESLAEMHTPSDRDALGAYAEAKNVIDVFVVARLEDIDEPGRFRKGVAWTQRKGGKRYIILSAEAPERVLGHELGHFFGNGHTTAADNLMSYVRTGGPVAFSAAQLGVVRQFSERFLASGRLVDVGVPRWFL